MHLRSRRALAGVLFSLTVLLAPVAADAAPLRGTDDALARALEAVRGAYAAVLGLVTGESGSNLTTGESGSNLVESGSELGESGSNVVVGPVGRLGESGSN